MVGLIPLYAVEIIEPEMLERLPDFKRRLEWFLNYRPDLAGLVSHWNEPGRGNRRLLSLLRGHRMKLLLNACWTKANFYPTTASARYREHISIIPMCSTAAANR